MGHQHVGLGGDHQSGGQGALKRRAHHLDQFRSGLTREPARRLRLRRYESGHQHVLKGVAHDLADRNITVNVIQAGVIDTGIAVAPDMKANMLARLASRPIKRPARVEEIAAGVLFLASPAASYMTGAVIDIDGGFAA